MRLVVTPDVAIELEREEADIRPILAKYLGDAFAQALSTNTVCAVNPHAAVPMQAIASPPDPSDLTLEFGPQGDVRGQVKDSAGWREEIRDGVVFAVRDITVTPVPPALRIDACIDIGTESERG